jgi:hypothetical protein
MIRLARALLALVVLVAPARALAEDNASAVESTGAVFLYVIPLGCSAGASVANGSYLAVREGAPMYWRTAGVVCGAGAIAAGIWVLADSHETGADIVLGTVPIVVGVGSIILALVVGSPQDLVGEQGTRLVPFVTAHGGGLALGGSF